MLGGRVKTLHPAIHGGILADRSKPEHLADLEAQGIEPIDLVVCNLYPFRSDPSIELIDVGGPTMVRAAAKNFAHVGVVVDPADYRAVLDELRGTGALSAATRRRLARAAFAHTAAYDAAIVAWFDAAGVGPERRREATGAARRPSTSPSNGPRSLRYGENPHQRGARYRIAGQHAGGTAWSSTAGTALSYLNLFDADAAWRLVHELAADAGGAGAWPSSSTPTPAARRSPPTWSPPTAGHSTATPKSAFGGIVALGGAGRRRPGGRGDRRGAAGRRDHRPLLRRRGPGPAGRPAQGHPAAVGPGPRAAGRQVRTLGATALVQDAKQYIAMLCTRFIRVTYCCVAWCRPT